jgi:hypothetical protein
MGSNSVGETNAFQPHPHTCFEFHRDISYEDLQVFVNRLARVPSFGTSRVCYVYGMGKHPKSTFDSLKNQAGVEVVFSRSVLPPKLRFLRWLVASYEGLIKITDPAKIPHAFFSVLQQSMAGIYFMDARYAGEFVTHLSNAVEKEHLDFGIKVDPAYSIFLVDADNAESSTGLVEICSYGIEAPAEICP